MAAIEEEKSLTRAFTVTILGTRLVINYKHL